MRYSGPSKPIRFTPIPSITEEAAASAEEAWSNEGGHMHAMSGYIVETPHAAEPYKVVFDHGDGPDTEQACRTVLEGKALIRRGTAIPWYGSPFPEQRPFAL
jgi:hypothetical protein